MHISQPVLNMEQQAEQPTVRSHEGCCPTCRQYTRFSFLGEQHWPPRLVELTGCPPVTYLFTCNACQTSVSEMDIE